MLYLFLLITALSIFFTFRLKKPILLTVPFFSIVGYFIFLIIQVTLTSELSFIEVIQFIYSLRG